MTRIGPATPSRGSSPTHCTSTRQRTMSTFRMSTFDWKSLRQKRVAVSLSGGMDSTAVLLLAVQNLRRVDALTTSADTDHPDTDGYQQYICRLMNVNRTVHNVPNGYDYFCRCVTECDSYLAAFNRYYDRHYHRPFRRLLRDGSYEVVLLGYRREEHQYIRGISRYQRLAPIYDWTKPETRAFLQSHRIALHPCYQQTKYLTPPIRESSWIDMEHYGLFHLANRPRDLPRSARASILWLRYYYPALYRRTVCSFPHLSRVTELTL